jgi:hypothetical protein
MTDMVGVEARSGAENGSADCLGTTGVPHEYFAHTGIEKIGGVVVAIFAFYRSFSDSVAQSTLLLATDRGLDSPGASIAVNKTLDCLIVSCHIS